MGAQPLTIADRADLMAQIKSHPLSNETGLARYEATVQDREDRIESLRAAMDLAVRDLDQFSDVKGAALRLREALSADAKARP